VITVESCDQDISPLEEKIKEEEKIQACLECGYFSKGVGLFEMQLFSTLIQLFSTLILYRNKFAVSHYYYYYYYYI